MTARAEETDKLSCFEAGMDEYLTKPVELNKLVEAIERHQPDRLALNSGRAAHRVGADLVKAAHCGVAGSGGDQRSVSPA